MESTVKRFPIKGVFPPKICSLFDFKNVHTRIIFFSPCMASQE
jgi:hypothetical protein